MSVSFGVNFSCSISNFVSVIFLSLGFNFHSNLVHSHTFYNSMFHSISLNEVWVEGFFSMVPHEEYGTTRFNFYDDMVRAHYYSHLQKHPLLFYDDAHIHGCTYDMNLSHLRLLFFLAQHLVHLMLEELHPTLG